MIQRYNKFIAPNSIYWDLTDNLIFDINIYCIESNSTLLTSKIYGGEKASQSDVVYIRQNGQNKCGGAMINYLVVLTAAHCVYESEINSYNDLEIVHDMKG